jgi:hypothetical protein
VSGIIRRVGGVRRTVLRGEPVVDELTKPSEGELLALPRRARVAFAARCARRVEPIFTQRWPGAPRESVWAVQHAITQAERFANPDVGTGTFDATPAMVAASAAKATADTNVAAQAAQAADAAFTACATDHGANHAAYAAYAAYAAAYAARAAADTSPSAAVYVTVNGAFGAADEALTAAEYFDAYPDGAPDIPVDTDVAALAAMRYDYELLRVAANEEHWTDETPVPPEFFGPLWPFGQPDDWHVKEQSAGEPDVPPVVHFRLDPAGASRTSATCSPPSPSSTALTVEPGSNWTTI